VQRLDAAHAAIALELIETRGSDGEICATASARIEIPPDWLASAPTDETPNAGKTAA